MKKTEGQTTELVFVIDASGSMYSLADDTTGGFNSLIEREKKMMGGSTVYVTTVLFNSSVSLLHDRVDIENVSAMTADNYKPSGCTALADAIGISIRHIGSIHRYVRPEDIPDKTIFVITTDGLENASKYFSADQVREMIQTQTRENGWEFIFLGANMDAVETAEYYGIDRSRSAQYTNSPAGTEKKYKAAAIAIEDFCGGLTLGQSHWKSVLE